jgi:hypothetical protein
LAVSKSNPLANKSTARLRRSKYNLPTRSLLAAETTGRQATDSLYFAHADCERADSAGRGQYLCRCQYLVLHACNIQRRSSQPVKESPRHCADPDQRRTQYQRHLLAKHRSQREYLE